MLYTFNIFDSASKTIFTDTLDAPSGTGPNALAYFLVRHLCEMCAIEDAYRTVGAWRVFNITIVILQTYDNRVLTVQVEP